MTKKQCLKKIKELKKQMNVDLDRRIKKILESGAIEISEFDNDCFFPKILIADALRTAAVYSYESFQKHPLSVEGKKIYDNLKHF